MALTLGEVKEYLRIDLDYDDAIVTKCMTIAKSYIYNAVDNLDEKVASSEIFEHEVDACILYLTAHIYENRDESGGDFPPFLRMLLTQLQYSEVAT